MDVDITNVVLHTKRLMLRTFRQEDLFDFNRYASVDGVGQPAGWKPHESLEESQEILDLFISTKKTLAIVHEGRVIGSLGIERGNEIQSPLLIGKKYNAIGYALAKEYWGQGLMPEAVAAVLKYLFEELELDYVLGSYFPFNMRSARVFEKMGFTYLGSHQTIRFGTEVDVMDTILPRETWNLQRNTWAHSHDLQS